MIYDNKDIAITIKTIEDLLFDIGIAKAELERKDLLNNNYSKLRALAIDLQAAHNLIDKYI